MTDEMLNLAEDNKRASGLENVEFLKGEIESIPLPDNSVDVIISNCVINLSGDKDRVLKEAFRVLKPGGRFAVSDVVVRGEVPPAIRRSMELWIGCIAGALSDEEYTAKLRAAGFTDIGIEVTRVYDANDCGCLAEDVDTQSGCTPGRRQVRERIRARDQADESLRVELLLMLRASAETGSCVAAHGQFQRVALKSQFAGKQPLTRPGRHLAVECRPVATLPTLPEPGMRVAAILVVLFSFIAPMAHASSPVDEPAYSPAALKAHVEFLADDLLEGREIGTRGYELAARYVATRFDAAGLGSPASGRYQRVRSSARDSRPRNRRSSSWAGVSSCIGATY